MTPVETPDPLVLVIDDALPPDEATSLRTYAMAQPFATHHLGGATFHGIALAPPVIGDLIVQADPRRDPTLSFFRLSPAGQEEPHYIHSDRSMGAWTALYYLMPDPPPEDGTIFWCDAQTGEKADDSPTIGAYAEAGQRWADVACWRPWYQVATKWNRLVIFPAAYYHSRALPDNYGTGATARLVNVTFGGFLSCQ